VRGHAHHKRRPDPKAECEVCRKTVDATMNGVPNGGSYVEFGVGYGEFDDCMGHMRHGILVCRDCLKLIPWLSKVVCVGGD
jgi:hypothetical protein